MDDIKYEQFGRDFIGHLRDRGLGNIPKRELDVLILHLLERHSSLAALSNGQAAVALRVPDSRVRSLRLEAALRYAPDLRQEFRLRLVTLLERSKLRVASDQVELVIEDAFTRSMLLSELKAQGSAGDWSFNSEIIRVGVEPLLEVLVNAIPDDDLAKVKSRLGATTVGHARKEAKDALRRVFEKLKERATGGVADLAADAVTGVLKELPKAVLGAELLKLWL